MNLTPFLEDDYLRLWNYSTQYCGKFISINNIKYCFVYRGYFKGDSINRYIRIFGRQYCNNRFS